MLAPTCFYVEFWLGRLWPFSTLRFSRPSSDGASPGLLVHLPGAKCRQTGSVQPPPGSGAGKPPVRKVDLGVCAWVSEVLFGAAADSRRTEIRSIELHGETTVALALPLRQKNQPAFSTCARRPQQLPVAARLWWRRFGAPSTAGFCRTPRRIRSTCGWPAVKSKVQNPMFFSANLIILRAAACRTSCLTRRSKLVPPADRVPDPPTRPARNRTPPRSLRATEFAAYRPVQAASTPAVRGLSLVFPARKKLRPQPHPPSLSVFLTRAF